MRRVRIVVGCIRVRRNKGRRTPRWAMLAQRLCVAAYAAFLSVAVLVTLYPLRAEVAHGGIVALRADVAGLRPQLCGQLSRQDFPIGLSWRPLGSDVSDADVVQPPNQTGEAEGSRSFARSHAVVLNRGRGGRPKFPTACDVTSRLEELDRPLSGQGLHRPSPDLSDCRVQTAHRQS
jgi:hypothetical protein